MAEPTLTAAAIVRRELASWKANAPEYDGFGGPSLFISRIEKHLPALLAAEAEVVQLQEVLTATRDAIASLDTWALGGAEGADQYGDPIQWPLRDELLGRIKEALTQADANPSPRDTAGVDRRAELHGLLYEPGNATNRPENEAISYRCRWCKCWHGAHSRACPAVRKLQGVRTVEEKIRCLRQLEPKP